MRYKDQEYAQKLMKEYQEHLNREQLMDVYEYALIDALCDGRTDERLFYAANLVLAEAKDLRNTVRKPNDFYAAVAYNCGMEYKKAENYNKAILTLEDAVSLAENEAMRRYCYQSLADAHYQAAKMSSNAEGMLELQSAIDHFEKTIKYKSKAESKQERTITDCYYRMAKVSEKLDQLCGREITDQTKKYAQDAREWIALIIEKAPNDVKERLEKERDEMEELTTK